MKQEITGQCSTYTKPGSTTTTLWVKAEKVRSWKYVYYSATQHLILVCSEDKWDSFHVRVWCITRGSSHQTTITECTVGISANSWKTSWLQGTQLEVLLFLTVQNKQENKAPSSNSLKSELFLSWWNTVWQDLCIQLTKF